MPHSLRSIGLPSLSRSRWYSNSLARRALPSASPADDGQRRIVAPLRRIADLRREHRELGARLLLGRRVHPRQTAEPRVHRGDDVGDQRVGLGLGVGGEISGDVQLADRLAERVGRRVDAALPPLLIDRGAAERGAAEGEAGVDEALRQQRCPAVERVEREIGLPRGEWLRRDQPGRAADRARVADDDARLRRHARGGQERRPRQPGKVGRQRGGRFGVVGLVDLPPFDPAPLDRGELRLEVVDLLRPGGGVGDIGEGEELRDIRLILRPHLGELRVLGVEVIVAVGHPQPALAEIDAEHVGVLQVLPQPDGDRHLDAVAVELAEHRRQRVPVAQRVDRRELRHDRIEPLRLDRRGIHEAGVIVADLARLAARRGIGARRRLDQPAGPHLAQVTEDVEHAERRAIVGNDEPVLVRPVGEAAEIVAWRHAAVHAGGVEAEVAVGRLVGGGERAGEEGGGGKQQETHGLLRSGERSV